jgi:predicted O-methyltransferase YrrM
MSAIADTLRELEEQRLEQIARLRDEGQPRNRDELMLAVGPETGSLLNTLLRALGAKRVLEIGGSFGYSTLWQAEALVDTGGHLISLEQVPTKASALRRRVTQAGLDAVVEVREGDAKTIIPTLAGPFDLVLIDAWKPDYPTYFDLVWSKLRVGGLVVADNITYPAPPDEGILRYVAQARQTPDARSQLVPVGSGLELTVKLPGPRPLTLLPLSKAGSQGS